MSSQPNSSNLPQAPSAVVNVPDDPNILPHTHPGPNESTLSQEPKANTATNATGSTTSEEDPEIAKVKGAFWRRAGQLQAAVGNLAGIDSWETAGRSTEGWANDVYQSAAERSANGEPSRVHGEYNRMMGILEQTVGHIAGDPEMEAKAGQRTRQAEEEILKSKQNSV